MGLLEELKTRRPTTQDAINCLEALSKYTNKKTETKKKQLLESNIKENIQTIKAVRAYTKRKKKEVTIKKVSILWGAFKLEW